MLLVRKQRRLAHDQYGSRTNAATAPPGYLQAFYRACAALGHPKPEGHTLMQYLERLDGEKVSIPFADELLSYHYGVTYREAARDAQVEKRLSKEIKGLGGA